MVPIGLYLRNKNSFPDICCIFKWCPKYILKLVFQIRVQLKFKHYIWLCLYQKSGAVLLPFYFPTWHWLFEEFRFADIPHCGFFLAVSLWCHLNCFLSFCHSYERDMKSKGSFLFEVQDICKQHIIGEVVHFRLYHIWRQVMYLPTINAANFDHQVIW